MLTYRQLIAQLKDVVENDPELGDQPVGVYVSGTLPSYGISHVARSVYGYGTVILTPWKD